MDSTREKKVAWGPRISPRILVTSSLGLFESSTSRLVLGKRFMLIRRLPELVQTIDDRFQAVTMEIEGLGKAPSENATAEMLDLITAFTTALKAQTAGSPGSEAFIQKVNEACLTFKSSIWATAPRFSPFTENERGDLEDYISVTASDIEEFRDSLVDGSGNDGHWMDLDDVREFIKKCASGSVS